MNATKHTEKVDKAISLLKEVASDELDSQKDSLAAKASELRSELDRRVSNTKETLTEGAGKVDKTVKENPWKALGVSALAGIAIGFLAGKRNS